MESDLPSITAFVVGYLLFWLLLFVAITAVLHVIDRVRGRHERD